MLAASRALLLLRPRLGDVAALAARVLAPELGAAPRAAAGLQLLDKLRAGANSHVRALPIWYSRSLGLLQKRSY